MVITPKLEKFLKSDGTCRIYIYLYDPATRTKAKVSTSYFVAPGLWVGGEVKKGAPSALYLNAQIKTIVSDLTNYVLSHPGVLPSQVKSWHSGPEDRGRFSPLSYFKHYIEQCRSGVITKKFTKQPMSAGYIKALGTSCAQFAAFGDVGWSQLDEELLDNFVAWLRDKGFKQNTIAKYIKYLVIVSNHALKRGVRTGDKLSYFVASEKAQKIRLTPDEVKAMSEVDLSDSPHLIAEQERFRVAYNLLLRFGDTEALNEMNIVSKGKKHYVSMFTQKSQKPVLIPLQDEVYRILKKNNFKLKANNKTSNNNLKLLGLKAKINSKVTLTSFKDGKKIEVQKYKWQLIETHTTRRSAARNLFDAGMAPEIIMVLGGWSTMKQLLTYIDIDLDFAAEKASAHDFFK